MHRSLIVESTLLLGDTSHRSNTIKCVQLQTLATIKTGGRHAVRDQQTWHQSCTCALPIIKNDVASPMCNFNPTRKVAGTIIKKMCSHFEKKTETSTENKHCIKPNTMLRHKSGCRKNVRESAACAKWVGWQWLVCHCVLHLVMPSQPIRKCRFVSRLCANRVV